MKHVSVASALAGATALTLPKAVTSPIIRADMGDVGKVLAELKKAHEDFKSEYDAKLKAKADVLIDEKVDRIDNAVDGLQTIIDGVNAKLAAIAMGAGQDVTMNEEERAYTSDFMAYFRGGDKMEALKARQRSGVRAAMSEGSNPDGGLLAPIEWDRTVIGKLKLVSPMRQICNVQQISTPGFTKVFQDRAVGSGWVGETAARPNTSNPQFSALTFTVGEIYANPSATQTLLDDAVINVETWLAGEVETEFARQEGIAFINGNGVNKPYGLLGYATGGAFAATHPFGAVPVVASGVVGGITAEGLINIAYDLPSAFTGNARWILNRRSLKEARKFKDTTGQYLWQPSIQMGEPQTLLSFGITEVPDMPDIATGNIPIAFGDFQAAYLIIDRVGIRVLRDPFTNKPYVSFYTTKRVGGGLINPEPIRFLKVQ